MTETPEMAQEVDHRFRRNMLAAGRNPAAPRAWFSFIGGTAFTGWAFHALFGATGPVFLMLPALIAGAFCFAVHRRALIDPHRAQALTDVLTLHIIRHRAALTRNLARAVKRNDYGIVTADKRIAVVTEFLDSIAAPRDLIEPGPALALIDSVLGNLRDADVARDAALDMVPSDATAFEYWVADHLARFGWAARVTSASADQGIDVIAEKDSIRIGIQCKLYSTPVGNKAVQEAIAGGGYYGLDVVAVLSNAPFTKSAIDLSHATGVVLMSNYDLADPDRILLPRSAA
jgi:restriction system protein